jgi:chromate transporter
MHTEVVGRRRWVSEQQFLDLVGATNLIPGPSSTELAIYLGFRRAGWRGLAAAGVCFIAPAFAIVLGLAVLYDRYGTTPVATDLLYGVTPVVLAIIAQALVLLGRTAVTGVGLAAVGLAALGGYLAGLHPLLLFAFGAVAWLAITGGRRLASRFGSSTTMLVTPALAGPWLVGATASATGLGSVSLATVFWTFLKLGSVVFGSGYVLLAFLRDDLMAGVAAQLARTALVDPLTVALAAATLGVLLRWRPNPTWLIAAGATVGLLRGWLG